MPAVKKTMNKRTATKKNEEDEKERQGNSHKNHKGKGKTNRPFAAASAANNNNKGHSKGAGARRGKRRPAYDAYWDAARVERCRAEGQPIVIGAIRINSKNGAQAFVTVDDLERDVFIDGRKHRNRALEGDIVAVMLDGSHSTKAASAAAAAGTSSTGDGAAVDDAATSGSDGETLDDANELVGPRPGQDKSQKAQQKQGRVIAVLEAKHKTDFVGVVEEITGGYVKFSPLDKRAPYILVPKDEMDTTDVRDINKGIFLVRIVTWSHEQTFPKGRLVRNLGHAGDIAAESAAILAEHEIDSSPFSQEVLSDLPTFEGVWQVPDSEKPPPASASAKAAGKERPKSASGREDLTDLCIVSIDPESARDLDDALHCRPVGGGKTEVGIHIADVSYFVRPGTALDREARHRATSTYLVHKVIPMLPNMLSQDLCSLNPDVERLAFSAIITLDATGKVVGERFTRSIIRSSCRLNYNQAQSIIDGKYGDVANPHPLEGEKEYDFVVREAHSVSDVLRSVNTLHRLSRKMREERFRRGAVTLHNIKLAFKLDPSTLDPESYYIYPRLEANELVEEFMLLANQRVAMRISSVFPDRALLRRHDAPNKRKLQAAVDLCQRLGFDLDVSTTNAMMRSIANPSLSDDDRQVLEHIATQPMQMALYFCTGDVEAKHWRHYALHFSHYTHFTSPIRRYADVIVHRLLDASLTCQDPPVRDHDDDYENTTLEGLAADLDELDLEDPLPSGSEVTEITEQCNKKKLDAKNAGDASGKVFLCLLLLRDGPMELEGAIFEVWAGGFQVLLSAVGTTMRVNLRDLGVSDDDADYDETRETLIVKGLRLESEESFQADLKGEADTSVDPDVENGNKNRGPPTIKETFQIKPFMRLRAQLGCKGSKAPIALRMRVIEFLKN